jgi:tRNA A-37 threonylcarbamoyl transferase component Bud32
MSVDPRDKGASKVEGGETLPAAHVSSPLARKSDDVLGAGTTAGDPDNDDLPRRVRVLMLQGMVGSVLVLTIDYVYWRVFLIESSFAFVVALRLALCAVYAAVVYLARPATSRGAWRSMWFTGCFACGTYALITHLSGGLRSLYPLGLMVMAMGAITVARPRREVLALHAGTLVAYVTAFACSLPWFPETVAQLGDEDARGRFGFTFLFALMTYALSAEVSETLWSVRREIFESKRVGRYVLRRRIGRGGMGEVWTAWHIDLRREVAVKFLHTQMRDTLSRQRFEREARATAELRHPNTVRVLDAGIADDGQPYYAMELLSGESLGELVEREGALAPTRALVLLEQAARAIGEAHALGIVHRDLKPENVFVCDVHGDEHAKVLDFGIARLLADADSAKLTMTGFIVGTPAYMAPEMVLGSEAGPPADVYALASVLYFAIAGVPPYTGASSAALLFAHVNAPVPRLIEGRHGKIDPALTEVLERALAKSPGDRFVDGVDFARALAAVPRTASHELPRPQARPKGATHGQPAETTPTRPLRR